NVFVAGKAGFSSATFATANGFQNVVNTDSTLNLPNGTFAPAVVLGSDVTNVTEDLPLFPGADKHLYKTSYKTCGILSTPCWKIVQGWPSPIAPGATVQ